MELLTLADGKAKQLHTRIYRLGAIRDRDICDESQACRYFLSHTGKKIFRDISLVRAVDREFIPTPDSQRLPGDVVWIP